jgi:superfamily I DNA/RNA helicase
VSLERIINKPARGISDTTWEKITAAAQAAETPTLDVMRQQARAEGMRTLRESGIELVRQGITTLEEVLGASNEDDEKVESQPLAQEAPRHQEPSVIMPSAIAPKSKFQKIAAVTQTKIPTVVAAQATGTTESKWKRAK